jgi:hypothetical protein
MSTNGALHTDRHARESGHPVFEALANFVPPVITGSSAFADDDGGAR